MNPPGMHAPRQLTPHDRVDADERRVVAVARDLHDNVRAGELPATQQHAQRDRLQGASRRLGWQVCVDLQEEKIQHLL